MIYEKNLSGDVFEEADISPSTDKKAKPALFNDSFLVFRGLLNSPPTLGFRDIPTGLPAPLERKSCRGA